VLPGSPSWGNDVTFDTVFSNASLHWCKRDPKAVLEGAKRILKPGGKFVGEMGGFMNCIGKFEVIHFPLDVR
jgi:ubiquinone/menaquinone biosynthesis C-methylase UbiE